MGEEGREARAGGESASPAHFSLEDWRAILGKVRDQSRGDRIGLVAAGIAFHLLLAVLPGFGAVASVFALFSAPAVVPENSARFRGLVPDQVLMLLQHEARLFLGQTHGALTLTLAGLVALALWSAFRATRYTIEAMNIVYDRRENRSVLQQALTAAALTLAAFALGGLFVGLVAVAPVLASLAAPAGLPASWLAGLRWPSLGLAAWAAFAALYRFGPSRPSTRWTWIGAGSGAATLVWIGGSLVFSRVVERLTSYGALYGSLSAVVGTMIWLWGSCAAMLLGAELNAEMARRADRGAGPASPSES